MQQATLDKLRRYIDLAAAQASVTSPPGFRWDGGREQLWQEFARAAEAEVWEVEQLSDEAIGLHHAVMDLME